MREIHSETLPSSEQGKAEEIKTRLEEIRREMTGAVAAKFTEGEGTEDSKEQATVEEIRNKREEIMGLVLELGTTNYEDSSMDLMHIGALLIEERMLEKGSE